VKKVLGLIVVITLACSTRLMADEPFYFDASVSLSLADAPAIAFADDKAVDVKPTGDEAPHVETVGGTASTTGFFASNHAGYVGNRGLITLEGVSGMFLNPTSGTLGKGQFTAQYCAGVLRQNDDDEIQHTATFSYGVTDWLEVGVFFRVSELDNKDTNVGAGGPLIRVRLLKEEACIPEVSVGGMSRNGFDGLTKHTLLIAGSKRFVIDEDGIVREALPHYHPGAIDQFAAVFGALGLEL